MSVLFSMTLAFPLSPSRLRTILTRSIIHPVVRQVGEGVNGNQTGNNGSTGGTGLGDGNGVGFAGTGNDIDTGIFFHHTILTSLVLSKALNLTSSRRRF